MTTFAAAVFVGLLITAVAVRVFLLPGKPVSYRFEPNTLVITDARGRECWRHIFPANLQYAAYAAREPASFIWFGDLDGDGEQEVLFAALSSPSDFEGSSPLICFAQDGRERWRFTPEQRVRSIKEEFAPKYSVMRFLVGKTRKNGPNRIIVSSIQYPYYPCQIALLSTDGKLLREYWHSGHLNQLQLADFDGDGNNELYAAGISNGRNSATLLVLDPEQMAGASEEPPEHQLLGFGPPVERARLLLPRSCVNKALFPYNPVFDFSASRDGLRVQTIEVFPNEAGVMHHLTADLKQYHSSLSDSYVVDWKRLHASKLIPATCTLDQEMKPIVISQSAADPAATPKTAALAAVSSHPRP